MSTQIKLLRVCCRSASSSGLAAPQTIRANVRLVAATNKDIEKGLPRVVPRDLYYA